MDILIVRRRNNGWIAFFQSKTEQWEYGDTQAEAIGRLIITLGGAPMKFYLEIKE